MFIENELKLISTGHITIQDLLSLLINYGYQIQQNPKISIQQDIYYDDKKKTLYKKDSSLRLRIKKDKIFITYKQPIKSNTIYKQREEYQLMVNEKDINKAFIILKEKFPTIKLPKNIMMILQINNKRNKAIIKAKDNTIIEIAIDHIIVNNKYSLEDEIEFEIISGNSNHLDYIYEILKLSYNIEKNDLSKYHRALKEISNN